MMEQGPNRSFSVGGLSGSGVGVGSGIGIGICVDDN